VRITQKQIAAAIAIVQPLIKYPHIARASANTSPLIMLGQRVTIQEYETDGIAPKGTVKKDNGIVRMTKHGS